jgi:glycosyltransferase involved in cell wall biosynthesis
MASKKNLLLFNLMTDRDDPILGFTTEWINALAPFFEKIFVVTMTRGVVEVPHNVLAYSVGKEQGLSEFRRTIRFYQIVLKIVSTEHIDVCFVHMIAIFAVLFFPFALLYRIPVLLWYCHTATPRTLRIAHRMVDRVVTCSSEGFRLSSSKLKIIGHGINTDIFKPAADTSAGDIFRIVTVGRLSPIKRCDILIQAVQETVASGARNISFTIVGGLERSDTFEYEAYLKRMVSDGKLDSIITFTGPVPFHAVPAAYQEADLFLHACNTGGIDKAVLEAMSSGCIVLSSNHAFKTIFGELSGLLFVPENEPKQFAAHIKKISRLPLEERRALGSRLRQVVIDNHSLKRLTAQLVQELQALTGS